VHVYKESKEVVEEKTEVWRQAYLEHDLLIKVWIYSLHLSFRLHLWIVARLPSIHD
jgi:hypothetical protein